MKTWLFDRIVPPFYKLFLTDVKWTRKLLMDAIAFGWKSLSLSVQGGYMTNQGDFKSRGRCYRYYILDEKLGGLSAGNEWAGTELQVQHPLFLHSRLFCCNPYTLYIAIRYFNLRVKHCKFNFVPLACIECMPSSFKPSVRENIVF